MKKSRLIFNILSILFISSLIIIYGYRLIHYYRLEHPKYTEKETKLYEVLFNNKGIEGTDDGLQTKDGKYVYGSKSDDNYAYYAGRIWRIIGIDENNDIRMITDEVETILEWDNDTTFENSDIYKWLNKTEDEHSGIFYNSLKGETEKLVGEISILSSEDYNLLEINNYINNNVPFWINDNGPAYLVSGDITPTKTNNVIGVRPVVTIEGDLIYISGNGSKTDPYIITKVDKNTLNDVFVGEYINYSGYVWRVIKTEPDKIKIALNDTLDIDISYNANNTYSLSTGVGEYLNNTFVNNLENNDYIISNDYYIGSYNPDGIYSYMNVYNNSINTRVGMYYVGEFYINQFENIYTLTPYSSTKNTIYIINNNKKLYADYVTTKHKVRPTIYIDSNLNILSGNGLEESPYEVGRQYEDEN
ncbi:MAG: hypothetical protein IJ565_02095 [Bacilli bacterium]|nr:hypothetical protein [Bacilli bacterium]